jgi:hypothetical protein
MSQDSNPQSQKSLAGSNSGNRCGHDPAAPRWFAPPPEHEPRPPVIREWIERARDFYLHPDKIPSLANALFGRKVAADPAGDHKPRRMRSERREACCDLLGAIVHYCDLPTLCLSVPQPDGSLLALKLATLADRAGLSLRRAERAMRDIVTGGLVAVHPRCEQLGDGTYLGRAAIRVVPPCVFGLFGLEARLEHDRRRISQKRREERAETTPTKTATARIRTAVGAALDKITGKGSTPTTPTPAAAQIAEVLVPDLPPAGPAGHIADMKAILAGESARRENGHRHQDQAAAAPTAAPQGDQAQGDQAKGRRGGNPQAP